MTTFSDLGLSQKVIDAVAAAGYTTPTPIQADAIPHAVQGKDVLGIAQTGTGKTASFVLPMLTRLERGRARARMPRTLILEPTRELAAQVEENFVKYGVNHKLTVALLIGGVSFEEQDRKLGRGVDVLIATPGRLLDHFERGKLLLTGVEILVIDEADRMLDMGFIPDIERICKLIPFNRQTLFFSATMPPEITRLTEQFLQAPVRVEVAKAATTAATVEQKLVGVGPKDYDKREALRTLIRGEENLKNAIIFCNRKSEVATLHKSLLRHEFSVGALHGDMDQHARMATLQAFRDNKIQLLVASDVAARGLDIPDVSHVFNFDIPTHAEDYVHRIGRTGRAGRSGRSFTLVARSDRKYLDQIEKLIGKTIEWSNTIPEAAAEDSEDYKARSRKPERSRRSKDGQPQRASRSARPERQLAPEAESVAAKPARRERAPKENLAPDTAAPLRQDPVARAEPVTERPARPEPRPTPAPRRADSGAPANENRRRERRPEREDLVPTGFGSDVPAFMMNGR